MLKRWPSRVPSYAMVFGSKADEIAYGRIYLTVIRAAAMMVVGSEDRYFPCGHVTPPYVRRLPNSDTYESRPYKARCAVIFAIRTTHPDRITFVDVFHNVLDLGQPEVLAKL